MRVAVIVASLLAQLLAAVATSGYHYHEGSASCEETKNLTLTCLYEEIVLLHSSATSIHGNMERLCDPLVSEQTCYLCRWVLLSAYYLLVSAFCLLLISYT